MPVFEPNQVLTSDLLNQAVYFLDDQTRETRVKLVGMGILCGLELEWDSAKLTLTCGKAITSHGYLLDVAETESYNYKVYSDSGNYSKFKDPTGTGLDSYDLWELIDTTQVADEEPTDLTLFSDDPTFLDDKAIMLYLEISNKDNKSCLGQDCDDKGITRYFTIRKLAITRTDLREMQAEAYGVAVGHVANTLNVRFDLPELFMPRATLVESTTSYEAFDDAIGELNATDAVAARFTAALNTPGLITAIVDAYSQSYSVFETVLEPVHSADPFGSLDSILNGIVSGPTDYIAYGYDFFNDLVLAYNEWREEAQLLLSECCQDTTRFPRHVAIGTIDSAFGIDGAGDRQLALRTAWLPTPIFNNGNERLLRVQTLHKRMALMIEHFKYEYGALGDEIRVTPSREKRALLSDRTIPFYYFDKGAPEGSAELVTYWNHEKWRRDRTDTNRNYYAKELVAPDPIVMASAAMHQADEFYRVEGLTHKDLESAMRALDFERKVHGLPFHVLPLKISHSTEGLEWNGDCALVGLKNQFVAQRNAVEIMLKTLISLPLFAELSTASATNADIGVVTATEIEHFINEVPYLAGMLMVGLPTCLDDFDDTALGQWYTDYTTLMQKVYVIGLYANTLVRILATTSGSSGGLDVLGMDTVGVINYLVGLGKMWDMVRNNDVAEMLSTSALYRWRVAALQEEHYFSNFAKKEPGMAHMAGVPKGGTLVLAYAEDETGGQAVKFDFALPHPVDCCCIESQVCDDPTNHNFGPITWPVAGGVVGDMAKVPIFHGAFDPTPDALRVLDIQPGGSGGVSGTTELGGVVSVTGSGSTTEVFVDYAGVPITFDADQYIIIDSFWWVVTSAADGVTPVEGEASINRAFVIHIDPEITAAAAASASSGSGSASASAAGSGSGSASGGSSSTWPYTIVVNPDKLWMSDPDNPFPTASVEWGGLKATRPELAWQAEIDPRIEALAEKLDDLIKTTGTGPGPIIPPGSDPDYWMGRAVQFVGDVMGIRDSPESIIRYNVGEMTESHANELDMILTGMYGSIRDAGDEIASIEAGTTGAPTVEIEKRMELMADAYGAMLGLTVDMATATADNLEGDNAFHGVLQHSVGAHVTQFNNLEVAAGEGSTLQLSLQAVTMSVSGAVESQYLAVENNYELKARNTGLAAVVSNLGTLAGLEGLSGESVSF